MTVGTETANKCLSVLANFLNNIIYDKKTNKGRALKLTPIANIKLLLSNPINTPWTTIKTNKTGATKINKDFNKFIKHLNNLNNHIIRNSQQNKTFNLLQNTIYSHS